MAVVLSFVGKWSGADLRKAEQEIARLKAQAGGASPVLGKLASSWKSFVGGAVAGLGAQEIINQLGDMASMAAEDETSVTKLAVALRNMGLASSQSGVEDFIKNTMLATGVADDQLRPALQRLVTASGNLKTSQAGLGLALDVSAGTGKDLATVSAALAKGYGGQTTALSRLVPGISAAALASKDMDKITADLQTKFGGQAAAAAGTYSGQMQRLTTAVDEAKESIGYGLLKSLEEIGAAFGGTGGLVGSINEAGDSLGNFTRGLGDSTAAIATWLSAVKLGSDDAGVSLWDVGVSAAKSLPFIGAQIQAYGWLTDKGKESNDLDRQIADDLNAAYTIRKAYTLTIDEQTAATSRLNDELAANKRAMDHLSARASVEAAIDAFGGLDSQGSKTWTDKHGKTHTSTFTKQFQTDWNDKRNTFNLGSEQGRQGWDAAKALIDATIAEASGEGPKAAAATYKYGRKNLAEQLTGIGVGRGDARAFARQNLGTPPEIARQVNNNQKTTVNIDARGRSQAEVNAIVNRVYRLAQMGTAPHGATTAADSTNVGRTSPMATDSGLNPAS